MAEHHDSTPSVAPYGTWPSPISAARVAAGALRLSDVAVDGDDVYWIEGRPAEGGRAVIVRRDARGQEQDVTPPGFNARSRAHEYGGGALLAAGGDVYFVNFADQRLYRQPRREDPVALTDGDARVCHAEPRLDRSRGRLIVVREDHRDATREPQAAIVGVPLDAGRETGARDGTVLVSGADFYSDPIVSPDGGMLAWLQWHHPNMPWDGTELCVAAFDSDGVPGPAVIVAGGSGESVFQPEWSPDGRLYFVSDRTGWWNLYRADVRPSAPAAVLPSASSAPSAAIRGICASAAVSAIRASAACVSSAAEALRPMAADFGKPQWTFSMTTYAFIDDRRLAATYVEEGRWRLALLDTTTLDWRPLALSLDVVESLRAAPDALYFIGGSPTTAPAIARYDLHAGTVEILRSSVADALDPAWISQPIAVSFTAPLSEPASSTTAPHHRPHDRAHPREHDREHPRAAPPSRPVFAFYYPPHNPAFTAPASERPPLLVLSHGGPTAATNAVLDAVIQFWTSRGMAVLDVNYSGSTGYGRAYRERLRGTWGIVDVEDVVAGALAMVEQGRADRQRLAIRGGSAGGYTTLAALTFHDVFRAGASYYGISDIEVLARDTHKFESRYLDTLIGPYPAMRDAYVERSPVHFTDRLSSALILFQGLDDKIVPPNQAEMMADAVRRKGLPVEYIAFEGEQHGFRRADTIVRCLESELAFYGRVFGFSPSIYSHTLMQS